MSDLPVAQKTAEAMREAIAEAGGNEVYFLAFPDEHGEITDFRVLARGNEYAVPAIINIIKQGDIVVHNHPSGMLAPSEADLEVASLLGNMGAGVYITDNEVQSFYGVVELQKPSEHVLLNISELEGIISPQGPVADKLRDYEYREGQVTMLKAVAEGFNQDKVVTVEAGTGTGKTLAYLIPAIKWALLNKERCLVTTNTINLQEQIIKKDIPFLTRVLRDKFSAVLVKGRNNYLCLRKAEAEARERGIPWRFDSEHSDDEQEENQRGTGLLSQEFADSETEELKHLIRWAHTTADGSRSDLPFQPHQRAWEDVQCEADTCTRIKCRYFDKCFLVKARRKAAHANILVVNHHLLCADLSLRADLHCYSDIAILPPYHRIIIDEVHHFEEVATEHFGMGITKGGFARMLGRIYSEKRTGESRGILSTMRTKLIIQNKKRRTKSIGSIIKYITENLIPVKDELVESGNDLFGILQFLIQGNSTNEAYERKVRITQAVKERKHWKQEIIPLVHQTIRILHGFIKNLTRVQNEIEDLPRGVKKELENALISLSAQIIRLNGAAETLHQIFFHEDDTQVKWIEVRELTKGTSISVQAAPLNVAPNLSDALIQPFKTVVMTSATIAVGTDFNYLHKRLGVDTLPSSRKGNWLVPSPFDYKKQVIIGVPLDIPDPNDSNFQKELDNFLGRALLLSGGRAFVLYTSYRMLNSSFEALENPLKGAGILALKQGAESRTRLLDTFRRDISSVLFGTSSFWEGVDVVGSALELVIIVKLPFRVPTEPIIEARVEDIERRGGNAFFEYTVPQAVIQFKQGFGRLIRRRTDRGVVIILDKRVRSKSYGRIFLKSLPPSGIVFGDKAKILEEIRSFFQVQG